MSPDGHTLATSGDGHGIRLWNPGTGELVATLNGHDGATNDLAFSPDGHLLASAGADFYAGRLIMSPSGQVRRFAGGQAIKDSCGPR